MEKYFYGTMKCLVAILFAVISSAVSAQKFETRKVILSDNAGIPRTVQIIGASSFSIRKDGRMTWAKYETIDRAVKVSASVNTTKNNRSCSLILLDGEGNPTDTLEVIQTGKISSTNSSVKTIGTSAGSSRSTIKTVGKSSRSSSGGQCAATTKKGTRCSRKAAAGSIYCWQHK